MSMGEDARLLRDYAESGSDRAFTALVDRYFNLVYATALRIANGDVHFAQDVAQSVFTDLANKAKFLPRDLLLGGWLYKHTCFLAANAVRKERRRRIREKQAFEMNSVNDESAPIWSSVGPVLDEAMGRLGNGDRNALVLRFFERKSFRAVGGAMGISEEAARKRVDRALEQLRGFFARRGLNFSAAVWSSALEVHAAAAAPAGLAAVVAGAALAEAAQRGGAALFLIKFMTTLTKAKIATAALAAGMTAALIIQSKSNSELQRANRQLAEQTVALSEKLLIGDELPTAVPKLDQSQFRELMRLRGEVGVLKDQLALARKMPTVTVDKPSERTPRAEIPTESSSDAVEQQRRIETAKMNYSKQFMLGMLGGGDTNDLATEQFHDQFQVVYQGSLNEITNPSQTIVLQEAAPMQAADGSWLKVYGFADGSARVHEEPDGNFEPWESQHMQMPAGQ